MCASAETLGSFWLGSEGILGFSRESRKGTLFVKVHAWVPAEAARSIHDDFRGLLRGHGLLRFVRGDKLRGTICQGSCFRGKMGGHGLLRYSFSGQAEGLRFSRFMLSGKKR